MKYQQGTFRILIDSIVEVEVSVKGCDHERQTLSPQQLRDAARTMDRLGRAVRRIQQRNDHERGKRAAQTAA